MLARCMLIFELYAILVPDLLIIDPFEYLKTRGCLFFQTYCGPDGYATDAIASFSSHYTSSTKGQKVFVRTSRTKQVVRAWVEFQRSLLIYYYKTVGDEY